MYLEIIETIGTVEIIAIYNHIFNTLILKISTYKKCIYF